MKQIKKKVVLLLTVILVVGQCMSVYADVNEVMYSDYGIKVGAATLSKKSSYCTATTASVVGGSNKTLYDAYVYAYVYVWLPNGSRTAFDFEETCNKGKNASSAAVSYYAPERGSVFGVSTTHKITYDGIVKTTRLTQ